MKISDEAGPPSLEPSSSGPRTLRRGLRILETLRTAGAEGMHITEVAKAVGMQRPTVYRFLDVLVEEGYVIRDSATPHYSIAQAWRAWRDAHQEAVHRMRPIMRKISDATGDSTFLICRSGSESLCLHREVGNYAVQVQVVTIGHRQPLGVGAAGLALLAALPEAEAVDLIEQNSAALRAYGNMTTARMSVLVQSTQTRGWSVVGDAAAPGVIGIGAAIRDSSGYPILALSVSSVADRMPPSRQRKIAEIMRRELDRAVL